MPASAPAPLVAFVLLAGVLGGCLGGDRGDEASDERVPPEPEPASMAALELADCRLRWAAFVVPADAARPFLPTGFAPTTPAASVLNVRGHACGRVGPADGGEANVTFADVWLGAVPPAERRGGADVDAHWVSLGFWTASPGLRAAMEAWGAAPLPESTVRVDDGARVGTAANEAGTAEVVVESPDEAFRLSLAGERVAADAIRTADGARPGGGAGASVEQVFLVRAGEGGRPEVSGAFVYNATAGDGVKEPARRGTATPFAAERGVFPCANCAPVATGGAALNAWSGVGAQLQPVALPPPASSPPRGAGR